jgi:carbamoyl-phosphate synthase large subunit
MMPVKGGLLVTVSDRDKDEVTEITKKLMNADYKIYATAGTAKILQESGIVITDIPNKYSETGSINTVDLINQGVVNVVVNTMSGHRTPLQDGFEIRRAATEAGIPCYTSLDTFSVAVDAMNNGGQYNIRRLSEYVEGI